jgi:SAM-dependent methyltransferase
VFADSVQLLPTHGDALELACGHGRATVWLANRGLEVWGVDVSPVAIDLAIELVNLSGVSDKCRFEVFDLDNGLPDGPPVNLIFSHLFRDPTLDLAVVRRLRPGGMLAISSLSEVGAGPGRFRVGKGELEAAFSSDLEVLSHNEADGMAALVARRN